MKALQLMACLIIALMLAACASQQPAEPGNASTPSSAAKYMYHTERNAQERMVTVYWVNPPKSKDLDRAADRDDG